MKEAKIPMFIEKTRPGWQRIVLMVWLVMMELIAISSIPNPFTDWFIVMTGTIILWTLV